MLTKIANCRAYADLNKCITILNLLKLEPRSFEDLQIYFSTDTIIALNLEDTLNLLNALEYLSIKSYNRIMHYEAINKEYTLSDLVKDILKLLIFNEICILHRIEDHFYIKIEQRFYALRNLLILSEVIRKSDINKLYKINLTYSDYLKGFSKKISKEQFLKQLEQQNQFGELAEKYILEYENTRLNFSKEIKYISLEDNNAGYDIASFLDINSLDYNKFIEVKCFSSNNNRFYISNNEQKKSRELGNSYFLYLVDSKFDSEPIIIQNPYEIIFSNPHISYEEESRSYEVSYLIEKFKK